MLKDIGGFLGKRVLQEIFPGYYDFKEYKNKQQKKRANTPSDKVDGLNEDVKEQNIILTTQIGIMSQQAVVLEQILQAVKGLKLNSGGDLIDDLIDLLSPDIDRRRRQPRRQPRQPKPQKTEEENKRRAPPKRNKKGTSKERIERRIRAFIRYLERKGLKALAKKVGERIAVIAAAAAAGPYGLALDFLIVAFTIYESYELIQEWENFQKEEAEGEANTSVGFDQQPDTNKKRYYSEATFQADKIAFKTGNMKITAQSLTLSDNLLTLLMENAKGLKTVSDIRGGESLSDSYNRTGKPPVITPGNIGKVIIGPEASKDIPKLTSINSKGGSTKVGEPYAASFQGFINDLEGTGYRINSIGGFDYRPNKSDPSKLSYHALGAAIDINPSQNPYGTQQTDLPPQIGQIAASHGLGWGMSFNDPMHFSAAKKEGGKYEIQQRPAYQQGTNFVPQTGIATVGEGGSEFVIDENGNLTTTASGATPMMLKKGSTVVPTKSKQDYLREAIKDPISKAGLKELGGPKKINPENDFLIKEGLYGAQYPKKYKDKSKAGTIEYRTEGRTEAQIQKTIEHELGHRWSESYWEDEKTKLSPYLQKKIIEYSKIKTEDGGSELGELIHGSGEEARQRMADLEKRSKNMSIDEIKEQGLFIRDYTERGFDTIEDTGERFRARRQREELLEEVNRSQEENARRKHGKTSIDFLEMNGGYR